MVLTHEKFQRRGWLLVNGCFLYKIEEEAIGHILFHGVKTRVFQQLFFSLFGIPWVLYTALVRFF